MGKYFNRIEGTEFRRANRREMPEAEKALWHILSRKQCLGYKFRRQYGIGSYAADFYCPKLKLVIEVDGESHYSKKGKRHDQVRDGFLKKAGIYVLRLDNTAVFDDLEGVQETIKKTIQALETNDPL
ncbi:endonuclease domain-containing protein [Patescibacteria group bacterium]|nr:endonuclease domain-containing protein [Patescibacteria group bacterium]